MAVAAADAGCGRDTYDGDWSIRTGKAPVTELPVAVASPTFYAPTRKHRTRMINAGTDTGSGRDTNDGDWNIRTGRAPVTELTPNPVGSPVISPTFYAPTAKQRTRMVAAATDAGCGRDTYDRDWSIRIGIAPVTELPVLVVSPTF